MGGSLRCAVAGSLGMYAGSWATGGWRGRAADKAEWQLQPLDLVYAVVFVDEFPVLMGEGQVANRLFDLALEASRDGQQDIMGLWSGEHGDGTKFWLRTLSEIKKRSTQVILMLVCSR